MSPVAHAGLGLLGWQLFDRKKTAGTLVLFVPFSNDCFNLPWFPYLRRWPSTALFSAENGAVILLEFVVFVLPVVYFFRKPLRRRWNSAAFWKI